MGRPLRIEYIDAFYHVTARGNERQVIFRSNRDRERFLEYLESASTKTIGVRPTLLTVSMRSISTKKK